MSFITVNFTGSNTVGGLNIADSIYAPEEFKPGKSLQHVLFLGIRVEYSQGEMSDTYIVARKRDGVVYVTLSAHFYSKTVSAESGIAAMHLVSSVDTRARSIRGSFLRDVAARIDNDLAKLE